MQHAYDYAARTGFTSTPHIVQLMYLTADAARNPARCMWQPC
jgi:hypothetical protein